MTSLEFVSVLDAFGIPIKRSKYNGNLSAEFDKLNFYLENNKYYAVVEGIIPMSVACNIYDKYPNNPYKIRVQGGNVNLDPRDYGTTYIDTYHIDTKEGLIIFIMQMRDFLSNKYGKIDVLYDNYWNFLEDVSYNILYKLNPFVSVKDWMKGAINDSYSKYLNTISKKYDKQVDYEIRKKLDIFDKLVNPFQDSTLDSFELNRFVPDVSIRGYNYNDIDGMSRTDCFNMSLVDNNTKDYVTTIYDPDGFYFTCNCGEDSKESYFVIHYFANHYLDNFDNGEVLVIEHYKKGKEVLNIRYNLTLGMVGTCDKDACMISSTLKRAISKELDDIIDKVVEVTKGDVKIRKGKGKIKNKKH